MNTKQITEIFRIISKKIEEKKEYLTELDMPIGDSDHGINMARGFAAAQAKIDAADTSDVGALLKMVGMTLVSQVGGSAGPLYGTAFMNAGKLLTGKTDADKNDFVEVLKVAIEGVQLRGQAKVGEATMIDAMVPAYEEAKKSLEEGADIREILSKAVEGAKKGAESTIPMVATKGRASYVGERGIGHMDPGAASFSLILEAIEEATK